MADILASVSVVLGAEMAGFKAAMADAKKELKGLVQFSEGLKDIGTSLTQYVSAPLALLAGAALAASGKIESLRNGLTAIATQELGKQGITGLQAMQQAAALTSQRMKELQVIGQQPGLGFEAAVQGDIRLRAVGISAEQSAKSIKAFGNAIATTGGGKNEFDRVTVQLAQLSAKGKVLAQDLRPIIEAAPAVSGALQKLYGTVDSETISKSLTKQGQSSTDFVRVLTEELGKLPQVTGGLKNTFENLSDTVTLSLAKVGDAISTSLNVPALGQQLSKFVTELADGFANLSPDVQQAVVAFGVFVAAAGPVLLAVGTLGAALPFIAGGLTLLAGPVGIAAAAFVALGAGIAIAAGSAHNTTKEFQSQRESVQALEKSVSPLLARYDELKAKTSLTKAEQEELRSIVQKVGEQIPTTITQFDDYGKALDINSAAAKQFVLRQQEILAIKNKDALAEQRQAYRDLNGEIKATLATLNQVDGEGVHVKFIASGDDEGGQYFALTKKEIEDLQVKLNDLYASRRGVGGLIDELKGLAPVLADAGSAATTAAAAVGLLEALEKRLKAAKAAKDADTSEADISRDNQLIASLEKQIKRLNELGIGSKKAQEALAKLRAELKALTELDDVLAKPADGVDTVNRRVKTLESGLKRLLEAGVSPTSAAFKAFATEALNLQQGLAALQASTAIDFKVTAQVKMVNTLGDKFGDQVAKLIGPELAAHPVEIPLRLMPVKTDFGSEILNATLAVSKGFDDAAKASIAFGASFDQAGANADLLRTQIEKLLAAGVSPMAPAVQALSAQWRLYQAESIRTTEVSRTLQQGILDLGGGIASAFGEALAGTESIGDALGKTVLNTISKVATQLGEILLASGLGIEALKKSLAAFSGIGAIAAGLGLIAIGGFASAAASKLGNSGGTSASSTPTTTNYGQNTTQQTIKVVAEFKLRGPDLVAVGRQQDYRVQRTA